MENKQQCLKNFVPMRQALVLGALLNLTGILLSVTVDMKYIILSGVVSVGLLVSGLLGWCPMAYFLAKLPQKKNN